MKRIALDLDGLLLDYGAFIKKHGSIYYGKKYNIEISNHHGFDVEEVFDLKNYFKTRV